MTPAPATSGRPVSEHQRLDRPAGAVAMRDVHDRLRRLILDGEFAAGSEVSQIVLAKRLQCSRTPLREALRLLESEGLVLNEGTHKLIRISPMSMVDLDDLYAARVLGEGLAIWITVPALTAADHEALARDLEATTAGDHTAHKRFHQRLRSGAGTRMTNELERLFEHAERYIGVYRNQIDSVTSLFARKGEEHRAILNACIDGDRDLARALMVDHLADTATELMTANRHAPFALTEARKMAKAGHS